MFHQFGGLWLQSSCQAWLHSAGHVEPTHLGPGVLLGEQVSVEVGHLPLAFVGEAPHQLPVAHVVELLPVLLGLAALLKPLDGLQVPLLSFGSSVLPLAEPSSSSM